MRNRIETRDLYEGAWLLVQGVDLSTVLVEPNGLGRPKVTFVFEGETIHRLRGEYRAGNAMAEVTRLRTAVNHLRDVLFDALRGANTR